MKKIKVLIVDDHAVVRMGLKYALSLFVDIELAGELADGEGAAELMKRQLYSLPGGFSVKQFIIVFDLFTYLTNIITNPPDFTADIFLHVPGFFYHIPDFDMVF